MTEGSGKSAGDSTVGVNQSQDQNQQASRPQVMMNANFLPAQFRKCSFDIARDICRYISHNKDYGPPPSKAANVMRALVDDTLKDRKDTMRHLVRTLNIQDKSQLPLLTEIANTLFDDETVNWGRVVTYHAFCAYVAKYCADLGIPNCDDEIGDILGNFVVNRLGLWIVTKGGWTTFEKQIPSMAFIDLNGLWKGLLVVGLLVGAAVAFYSSVRFMNSVF